MSEIRLTEQAIEIELNRLNGELKSRSAEEIDLLDVESDLKIDLSQKLNWVELRRVSSDWANQFGCPGEYQKELERKSELDHQHAELKEALRHLKMLFEKLIERRVHYLGILLMRLTESFGEVFPQLFGGGEAWLMLTDEDLLSAVYNHGAPPGKRNSSIYLLSGGEKALTALSLVFAIFQLNPAPFCFLDEVDAPLDDANVGRYAAAVAKMSQSVQFIFITHNKISMERLSS